MNDIKEQIPWTEWHGGECPLKDEKVEKWEYKYLDQDGKIDINDVESLPSTYEDNWRHDDAHHPIIAYRVLKWREGCGPDAVDWKIQAQNWECIAKVQQAGSVADKARAEKAEAELAAAHAILDNDESQIIRNARNGYPDGREDRVLSLAERVQALCIYAADWKRWHGQTVSNLLQVKQLNAQLKAQQLTLNVTLKQNLELLKGIEQKLK